MTPLNITALSQYLTVEARLLIQLDPFNAWAQVLISDIWYHVQDIIWHPRWYHAIRQHIWTIFNRTHYKVKGTSTLVPYLHTIAYHSQQHISHHIRWWGWGLLELECWSIQCLNPLSFNSASCPKCNGLQYCNIACTDFGIAYMHICANVHACNAIAILQCCLGKMHALVW